MLSLKKSVLLKQQNETEILWSIGVAAEKKGSFSVYLIFSLSSVISLSLWGLADVWRIIINSVTQRVDTGEHYLGC